MKDATLIELRRAFPGFGADDEGETIQSGVALGLATALQNATAIGGRMTLEAESWQKPCREC
jgi:hypothetical protein